VDDSGNANNNNNNNNNNGGGGGNNNNGGNANNNNYGGNGNNGGQAEEENNDQAGGGNDDASNTNGGGSTKFGTKIKDFFVDMYKGIKNFGKGLIDKGKGLIKTIGDSSRKTKLILLALVVSFGVTFIVGLIALCVGYHCGCCGLCCVPAAQTKKWRDEDTADLEGEPTADYVIYPVAAAAAFNQRGRRGGRRFFGGKKVNASPIGLAIQQSVTAVAAAKAAWTTTPSNTTPLLIPQDNNDTSRAGSSVDDNSTLESQMMITFDDGDETQVYGNLAPIDEDQSEAASSGSSSTKDRHSETSSLGADAVSASSSAPYVGEVHPDTITPNSTMTDQPATNTSPVVSAAAVPTGTSTIAAATTAAVTIPLITKRFSISTDKEEAKVGKFYAMTDDQEKKKDKKATSPKKSMVTGSIIVEDLKPPAATKHQPSPTPIKKLDMTSVAEWKPARAKTSGSQTIVDHASHEGRPVHNAQHHHRRCLHHNHQARCARDSQH
jgi:hypothetical protein